MLLKRSSSSLSASCFDCPLTRGEFEMKFDMKPTMTPVEREKRLQEYMDLLNDEQKLEQYWSSYGQHTALYAIRETDLIFEWHEIEDLLQMAYVRFWKTLKYLINKKPEFPPKLKNIIFTVSRDIRKYWILCNKRFNDMMFARMIGTWNRHQPAALEMDVDFRQFNEIEKRIWHLVIDKKMTQREASACSGMSVSNVNYHWKHIQRKITTQVENIRIMAGSV